MKKLLIILTLAGLIIPVRVWSNTCVAGKPMKISGALCGRVIDPTGAVVPDAGLRIVDTSGKPIADAKANSNGDFRFPQISAGQYRLTTTSEAWRIQFGGFQVTRAASKCRKPVTVRLGIMSCQGDIEKKRPHHFVLPH